MNRFRGTLLTGICLAVAGCGGGSNFKTAPVSGTVRCNGTLITAGLVVFTPIPKPGTKTQETGRSATGIIQADGTFILSTYKDGDGAIIGRHRIQVMAPPPEDDDSPLTDENRFACGNETIEEEVEEGGNVLELELNAAQQADA
jgi:hypothetical protein